MKLANIPKNSWHWRLCLLALFWGSSFLLISIALQAFTPLGVAFGRLALGAIALLIVLRMRGDRLPRSRDAWFYAGVSGIWMNAVPFAILAYGLQHVSSVIGGMWNAATPLLVILASLVMLPTEHPTWRNITGVLLGFVGISMLLGVWRGFGEGELIGHIAMLATVTCYGTGTPFMRRTLAPRSESTVALSAVQIGVGAVVLIPVMAIMGDTGYHAELTIGPIISVLVLGFLCTGMAYILYTSLVRSAGAFVASSVTYLIPVVATTLGVVVLGEHIGWNEPVGGLVILAGVAIATSTRAVRRA